MSVSGNCFFLGDSCISWLSKKQPTVATSRCDAEYMAVFTATMECIWLRCLLMYPCMQIDAATHILADSQSALVVARNPVFHARTKHIEVHYHYVRECLHVGDIDLVYVPTQDNVACLFTKPLPREKFEGFRKVVGLLPCGVTPCMFTSFAICGFVTLMCSSCSFDVNLFPIHGHFLL